jgi:hypothetical protein
MSVLLEEPKKGQKDLKHDEAIPFLTKFTTAVTVEDHVVSTNFLSFFPRN